MAVHRSFLRPFSILLVIGLVLTAGSALAAGPKVGEPAPDFVFFGVPEGVPEGVSEGQASVGDSAGGELHRLAEHKGKRGVVVAWFPKAFTPG